MTPKKHHSAPIVCMRVVHATPTDRPASSLPVDLDSGWPSPACWSEQHPAPAGGKRGTSSTGGRAGRDRDRDRGGRKQRGGGNRSLSAAKRRAGRTGSRSPSRQGVRHVVSDIASVDSAATSSTIVAARNARRLLPGSTPVHRKDRLVSMSTDGVVAVWDVQTMDLLFTETHAADNGMLVGGCGGVLGVVVPWTMLLCRGVCSCPCVVSNCPGLSYAAVDVSPDTSRSVYALSNSPTPVMLAPTAKHSLAVPAQLRSRRAQRLRARVKKAKLGHLKVKAKEHHHHAKHLRRRKLKSKHRKLVQAKDGSDTESDTESEWEESADTSDSDGSHTGSDEDTAAERACTAARFSADGTVVCAGFDDRTVLVLNACYPESPPVGKFVAYGSISAVAMGGGLHRWDTSSGGADEEGDGATGPHNGGGTAQAATETGRGNAGVVGAGDGRIGLVVAGDSTGAVFLLEVVDGVQVALAARRERLVNGELDDDVGDGATEALDSQVAPDTPNGNGSDSEAKGEESGLVSSPVRMNVKEIMFDSNKKVAVAVFPRRVLVRAIMKGHGRGGGWGIGAGTRCSITLTCACHGCVCGCDCGAVYASPLCFVAYASPPAG